MRWVLFAICLASPVVAEEVCPGGLFRVSAPDAALSARICKVAEAAVPELAACGLPIARPVRISVVESFESDCMGLYHCGEDLVEVLSPEGLARVRRPDSLFAPLTDATYFDSIVVHELAHAAYDAVPCPFDSCLAESEYLAYTSQIASLPEADRAAVEAGIPMDTRVTHDAVNDIMLMFAPDRFAQSAWAHLNQREDPCAYTRMVADGRIAFGASHP
ncbi:DUF6639 family protein [Salipiger mucosus]|uniref:Uncharacterized protein n=1 Tax=Salipiger mucosus DSM 16094 TaxID=1123237 RepID=S9QK54_9RHOB|nr:DUF6639 family protein [Salipiger mucosus]EPX81851.1 hypothetical protein Salmuc_03090 [Salipiger mucosus DSM 16094]